MGSSELHGPAIFKILQDATNDGFAARLGRLSIHQRKSLDTPDFFPLTSRGAIPHMTPDNVTARTNLGGVYMALEDFLEVSKKRPYPAIYNVGGEGRRPLHTYTATPSDMITVLAARRHTAVTAPTGNGNNYISIFASTGFQQLKKDEYHRAVDIVKPDIAIPLADLTYSQSTTHATSKRQLRMVHRTEEWLSEFFNYDRSSEDSPNLCSYVFAPLLPVNYGTQWEYINRLEEDYAPELSGLAVYDIGILPDLSNHPALISLPRLSLHPVNSPHDILRQIHLGIDVFTIPFLNSASDGGVALTFVLPQSTEASGPVQPLGVDMWSQDHQVSVSPLKEGCKCYTCTKHHRAFLHHLLQAKEMLGWTLLQIHNHHVMTEFFADVRAALGEGEENFEKACNVFARLYDTEIPQGTGARPRARGYNFKSEGADPKMNPSAWENYNALAPEDPTLVKEMAGLAATGATADGQETPIAPQDHAKDLDQKGFAEIDK
ncbi:tRNA-guanine transglycosylase family protein [Xylariaceae sp. FL0016]|nr:tRNA-guanine transglycosylase family protein [Xylariaceae sp. FL0016]